MVEKDYEATVKMRIIANNQKEVKNEILNLIAGKVADFQIVEIEVL